MLLSWVRLKTPQSSRKDAHIPIPYWPRRPPQPLSRSDLVLWHFSDVAFRLGDVRLWKTRGNGGGAALKGANIYRLSGKFRHLGRQTACAPSRAEEWSNFSGRSING